MPGNLTTQTRLRKALRKVSAPQTGWLDVFDAITGRADGTVLTGIPGLVYVRNILNGQVLAVYNGIVSARANVQVEVGRRVDQPGIWRIKGEKQPFTQPGSGGEIGPHADQHEFPAGSDIGFWDRKQVLAFSVLVSDAENFIVRVYGGVFNSANGVVQVDTQDVYLSSYVGDAFAQFVTIETDDEGVLSVNQGVDFYSPLAANVSYIPAPDAGKYMIAYILLYEGQTELSNADIRVMMPLGFNAAALDDKADADHEHETHWEPVTIPAEQEFHRWQIDGALATVSDAAESVLITRYMKLKLVWLHAKNNGSASSTIVDVNLNSTTIFTTSGHRPELGNADDYAVSGIPDVVDLVPGDVLTMDIDQIATGATDLTITITEVIHDLVYIGDELVMIEVSND